MDWNVVFLFDFLDSAVTIGAGYKIVFWANWIVFWTFVQFKLSILMQATFLFACSRSSPLMIIKMVRSAILLLLACIPPFYLSVCFSDGMTKSSSSQIMFLLWRVMLSKWTGIHQHLDNAHALGLLLLEYRKLYINHAVAPNL